MVDSVNESKRLSRHEKADEIDLTPAQAAKRMQAALKRAFDLPAKPQSETRLKKRNSRIESKSDGKTATKD